MADTSRQLTRQGLNRALDAAMAGFQARIQILAPEAQALALQCAEGIQACLRDLAETHGTAQAVQEALTRLIHSHADPNLVGALREFAEVLILHLSEARDRLQSQPKGRRDS